MAGSGLPPLPNIPYCCLPQESGPCLSTSVGDRPLRSPTHRGLGGPSPRLPSNGTHARPRPPLGFIPRRMPSTGTMAYYPAFPPAIRLSGVGCIRVAHPCATLRAPEGAHPVRLACIRPAASVHPEPGSNSSLYYCLSCLYSESRVPPRCPLGVPFKRFLPSRRFATAQVSCAGLRLSKNFRFRLPSRLTPRSFRKRVQKYSFLQYAQHFIENIFLLVLILL